MTAKNITVNASDLLAAIAFEAQRIVAAVGQHAAGAPFPDPDGIAQAIARMQELNGHLHMMQAQSANTEAA